MRRGVKTFTTVRAAVIDCALCGGLLALMTLGGAFPALGAAAFALYAMPQYLLISGFVAGFLPMALCLLMTLAALALSGGPLLLLFGALYLLPMTAAYLYCLTENKGFWLSCGWVAGTLAASLLGIYLILQGMTDGALFQTAGSAAAAALNDLPVRDSFLYLLCSSGYLVIPQTMRDTALIAVSGGYAFSEEAASELLLQVRASVAELLQALVPSMMVSGSGTNALTGLALGIYFGKRAAQRRAYKRNEEPQKIPDLDMPPLRTWHIPRPWGLRIGLMAVGYLLVRFAVSNTLYMLGALMWQAFYLCFAVQGLATMNYAQHKRGTGRGWRTAVVVLAMVFRFMQIALAVVGVVDQFSDSRGLRPPLLPRNEEE